ncbi:MAG: hypothetical protein LBT25_09520 [Candidatus Symbiothrix sp.]|nr:hypothetical protein [Candidatus Symbiothrix sp.]
MLNAIIKELETKPFDIARLGLRGATGISLFFFLYARHTDKEEYEERACTLLEKVLENTASLTSHSYAQGIAGVGNTVRFLLTESFVEADSTDFFNDIDKIIRTELKKEMPVAFGFESGITGLGHYALQSAENTETIRLTVEHLLSAFRVSEYQPHCVSPLFLFPSEILQDVKLFLLQIKDKPEFSNPISSLHKAIETFEKNNAVLQSNCPEYFTLQALRAAELNRDLEKIHTLLPVIASESSDIVLQGLACMSLENPALPAWWKLY